MVTPATDMNIIHVGIPEYHEESMSLVKNFLDTYIERYQPEEQTTANNGSILVTGGPHNLDQRFLMLFVNARVVKDSKREEITAMILAEKGLSMAGENEQEIKYFGAILSTKQFPGGMPIVDWMDQSDNVLKRYSYWAPLGPVSHIKLNPQVPGPIGEGGF